MMLPGGITRDIRFGLRTLRARPGFAAVAILTLALGVGANSAIFTFVNAVLLRPLPYGHPDELVAVGHVYARKSGFGDISALSFMDYRSQSHALAEEAAYSPVSANLVGYGEPEHVPGLRVSEQFFHLLGVQPAIGRFFSASDYDPSGEPVVVLSHALWRRHFASDPGVVGHRLDLSGRLYTVVGIASPGFHFGPTVDYWRPLTFPPFEISPPIRRSHEWLAMIGRLKRGTSLAAARAEFARIADRMRSEHPDIYPSDSGWRIEVHPYREDVVGGVRPALLVLFGVVGFVLLISCINVANLLLASAEGRRKEFAVRIALGSTKSALVRQLLVEGSLLAFLGGNLGLLLAALGVSLFRRMGSLWLPPCSDVSLDEHVVLFTFVVCGLTTLIFGLAPATQAFQTNVQETVNNCGRGLSGGRRGRSLRNALVIAEVALSLPLLAASLFLADSLRNLVGENPGFATHGLLVFDVALPVARYEEHEQVVAFHDRLLAAIRSLPGVKSAGAVSSLPLRGSSFSDAFTVERRPRLAGQSDLTGDLSAVSPDYFAAMGVPLLRGRSFREGDSAARPGVAIIDEELAHRLFPLGDALGKRLNFEGPPEKPQWREIVGIVGHVKQGSLDEAAGRSASQYYVPLAQGSEVGGWQMSIVIRAASTPETLIGPVRSVVRRIDPQQAIHNVSTMAALVSSSLLDRRAVALLVGLFAALALLLAASGLYGVISHLVGQQKRSIGVRLALGARPQEVLSLVLTRCITLAARGVATGLILSIALGDLLNSQLYGVKATNWQVLASVALFLLCISLLAAYVPARRAMLVNPMIVLREE